MYWSREEELEKEREKNEMLREKLEAALLAAGPPGGDQGGSISRGKESDVKTVLGFLSQDSKA